VNSVAHGRGVYRGCGGGGHDGFGRGFVVRGELGSSTSPKPVCQLCKKTHHTVKRYWNRFNWNYTNEEKSSNNTENLGYNVDTAWYSDTGAMDHITSELDRLAVREKYSGQEQIHATNGGGMQISHVGHSTLCTPYRNILLKDILHVPSAKKNLVSVHRFTRDNHVFIEYHPYFFLVKDPTTRRTPLCGRCRGGLYPFHSLEQSTTKCVLSTIKPSINWWHERLGHPSMVIVQRVLDENKLAFLESQFLVRCVMHVNMPRVINCLSLDLLA
jgi:hypothetical protein